MDLMTCLLYSGTVELYASFSLFFVDLVLTRMTKHQNQIMRIKKEREREIANAEKIQGMKIYRNLIVAIT